MNRTLVNLVFWVIVVISSAFVAADFLSSEHPTPEGIQVTRNDIDVILERFNDKTLDIGLATMQELVKNEHDRFRQVDAKATTYIGMLSISLAVFGLLGAFGINIIDGKKSDTASKQEATDSNGLRLFSSQPFRNRIIVLYSLFLVFLLFSFLFAMLATRVPNAPSSEFVGFQIPGRHDVNPEVVIGKEYIGLEPPRYKKVLLGEFIEVYTTNVHTNDVKASRLSRCQVFAFGAWLAIIGISIMAVMGALWGPPNQKPVTAPPGRNREKTLEIKSA